MAFQVVQDLNFSNTQYKYDRSSDVLYISFGSPVPAVALQVEDWLAIRVSIQPPYLAGITIVGFKRIFEKINQYMLNELPERIGKLTKTTIKVSYDDQTDILIMRLLEMPTLNQFTIFERLTENIYLEKTIPSKDVIGVKFLEYTKCGPSEIEAFFGSIIDTIFEPEKPHDENAHLVTNALLKTLDLKQLAALPT